MIKDMKIKATNKLYAKNPVITKYEIIRFSISLKRTK